MNSHWCNTHHHTLTICWHTWQEKNWQSVYLSHTCEPLWFKGQLSWWTEELGDGLFMSQLGHVLVIVPSAGPSKMYLLYNMYPSPTGLQWVYSRQTRAETCCHWRSGECVTGPLKIGHAELLSNGVAGEIDPETIVKLTTTNTND